MDLMSDPPIAVKIEKMKQRVRWREPLIEELGIDQTRMVLDDGRADDSEFSFLVMGDSGSGPHRGHHPQRQLAELMLPHREECRFVLHTGDVVYLAGSSEYYQQNFIEPYREFLVGGDRHIPYDRMVFNLPVLPVPGNHDYYDLPLIYGLLMQTTWPLRHLFGPRINFNLGWHGSEQGKAYAKAFLDYLQALKVKPALGEHLDRHYTAKTDTGRCLRYEPGHFTRLPNRYYTFRYGGIDFFALDSNTFNAPSPLPATPEGKAFRHLLEKRCQQLESEKQEILETSSKLDPNNPEEAEQLDDLDAKLEQIEEVIVDIEKQLASDPTTVIDFEQLDWLRQRLIESWHSREVRGRVIYFHHPPYVTEATKWHQAQTLTIRRRLRQVLDAVAETLGELPQGRPLVDVVFNGHAHCLEYLRTGDTGHADSHIDWIVCGGSGYSLRRQRPEGPELQETFGFSESGPMRPVAYSKLFVGRTGRGTKKRRPYSFLRVDVQEGRPPKFRIRPFVAERYKQEWRDRHIEPFII
jgi:3',5'-cyclic AMP phosphodiesterase CpdA